MHAKLNSVKPEANVPGKEILINKDVKVEENETADEKRDIEYEKCKDEKR